MSDYCTIEQLTGREAEGETAALTGYLPDVTADGDREKLAAIITRVSRRIDAYVTGNRATDFFAPSPSEPTEQTIFGDDLSFLALPEFVPGSVVEVKDLTGALVEDWIERKGRIDLTDTDGRLTQARIFREGEPYTVKARWGLAATPGDVTEACLMICVRTYRSADEAFSGVIGAMHSDNQIIERAWPAAARDILDAHRRTYRARRLTFA